MNCPNCQSSKEPLSIIDCDYLMCRNCEQTTSESEWRGGWENVDESCLLCEMEKKTEWHLETKDWVIAEKIGGGPFVVYKSHQVDLSDEEWQDMERVVGKLYDKFELDVVMAHVPDHFHAHISNYTKSEDGTQ